MKIFLVMLVIVFCFPASIFSQVEFTTHTITTSANNPRYVFAADVDDDGDMDVLSASLDDNTIAWYENDGYENFSTHIISNSMDGANSVYAVDLDSDGDMDVLSTFHFDCTVVWFENDGNENFNAHVITNSTSGPRTVYAVDIDGDKDIDVLSASSWDDKIAWYENDGNKNFTAHTITTSADYAWAVYAADVNGDGDMDVLSASSWDNKIAWYENDGNENFATHIITTSAVGAESVYAADVDSDGDTDVLSTSFDDNEVAWYENDGYENFTSRTITESAHAPFSASAADVDGDGDKDVLFADGGIDEVAWYENDGSENFTRHTIAASADGVRSVYAVDVDGDGDMDVVSASEFDDKIAWYENLSPHIPVEVEFDIKPQSCPNPINVKDKGNIPVAILGTGNFDVLKVDPTTILFEGVAPIRWAFEDVTTPVAGGEQCDCTTDGPDGFADLTLKFDAQEIIAALGSVKNGDELVLTITGNLINGTPIKGSDCVIIKAKGNLSKSLVGDLGQLSEEYALYENYPNPFSSNTTIQFAVPEQSFIKLEVYNSLGKKLTTLVSEELEAGTYSTNWNTKNLPNGFYFYRIEASYPSAGSVKVFQQVKKMTLIH